MNIFSNIGITELVVILLLALIVVGPERLPEMGRKLAKMLRDFLVVHAIRPRSDHKGWLTFNKK